MNRLTLGIFLVFGLIGSVHATLHTPADGQIYDDVLDIYWLQDANLVNTLCNADDPLWQKFDPSAIANNSGRSNTEICDIWDGALNWYEAEGWIAHLNVNSYKGYNTWRQPATGQPDPTCSGQFDPGAPYSPQGFGYRCTGSELGHLFNADAPDGLGNPNALDNDCDRPETFPDYCLQNNGSFQNLQSWWRAPGAIWSTAYWSGTESAQNSYSAWGFFLLGNVQATSDKDFLNIVVWPVRPRQTPTPLIPTPIPAIPILGLGLMVLLLAALGQRRFR